MIGLPNIFMAIWFLPLIGFILSLIITLIVVQTTPLHAHLTTDLHDGPQKIHQNITPRIGGVAMFVSMIILGFMGMFDAHPISFAAIGATIPVFFGGLLEDFTGRVSPRIRLLLAIISGACFVYLSDFTITRVSFAPMDALLALPVIAAGFTIFAITLFANAVNIIDGLNGLSIGTAVLIAGAVAGVAGSVGDMQLMTISMLFAASVLGVGLFNFPKGKIFVGDGGAYFMGTFLAFLVIILPERNEAVSPLFSLLLVIYPSYELVRSTIRRLFAKDSNALQPDQKHLHSLVYLYFVRFKKTMIFNPNARAGLVMLIFPLFTTLWALINISSEAYTLTGIAIFIVVYEVANRHMIVVVNKPKV